jgi:hypothetical protein
MPIDLDPIIPSGLDGYYPTYAGTLAKAGQEQFDADARLDPAALVADDALVADVFARCDAFIDGEAFIAGLSVSASDPPHYVGQNQSPAFAYIRDQAEWWSRCEIHLMRGEPGGDVPLETVNGPPDSGMTPEGKFRKKKNEAERNIRAMLKSLRFRVAAAAGGGGIGVGFSPKHPCGTPNTVGIDPIVVNGGI